MAASVAAKIIFPAPHDLATFAKVKKKRSKLIAEQLCTVAKRVLIP